MTGQERPCAGKFDKVTLITGGTRGIGEGCARVFVEAGAKVMICARGVEAGRALAAELTAAGPGQCAFEACDVSREDELSRVVARTVERFGRLDCLINNAGYHPPHRPIDGFSAAEFEDLLRLNLVSYFVASKAALPHLRQTHGSIVNVSSLVGSMGQEWACTYVATKGAITALTKALAVDEARNGVRVNSIAPGVIETPMHRSFVASKGSPEQVQEFIDSWQWQGRIGSPADVGYAALYLASDQAGFVTGIEVTLSGGAELAYGIKWPKGGSTRL
jgi:NAD(P)-dependent dehydrogenase (short-subunit alcohol dehydrogenase family)